MAISLVFDQKSPLPKVSSHGDWYKARTGGLLCFRARFELGVLLRNKK